MSRYHKGPLGINRSETVRNLQSLERIERKKKMARILDPLGLPAGSNGEPQQMQFNPVLGMLWPLFCQCIHDLMTLDHEKRPLRQDGAPVDTPSEITALAWEIANRGFQRMGFEFVFPMCARLIPPAELHASDKAHAEAGQVVAAGPSDA